jgi:hypothetical protein
VLRRVHCAEQLRGGDARRVNSHERNRVPARPRHEGALGEFEVAHLDDPVGRDLLALVGHDVISHLDRSEVGDRGTERCARVLVDDGDVGLGARLRVLVGVFVLAHERDMIAHVELVDSVLATLMQIDRARMRDVEDARVVNSADHLSFIAVDQAVLDGRPGA